MVITSQVIIFISQNVKSVRSGAFLQLYSTLPKSGTMAPPDLRTLNLKFLTEVSFNSQRWGKE